MKILQHSQARTSSHSRALARGFSLVELLVVITIIVIIAGITIGVVGQVRKNAAKKETSVRLGMLKNKVETYASDNNNTYPVGDDALSGILYRTLSGDFSGNRSEEPTGEIYWPELLQKNSGLTKREGDGLVIIDAFQSSFRYRSGTDLEGNEDPLARNIDFDAWSIGPDQKPIDPNVDSKLKNEETADDIWE